MKSDVLVNDSSIEYEEEKESLQRLLSVDGEKKLRLAFVSNGGLTNLLINLNFVHAFCKKFKKENYSVFFFGHLDPEANAFLAESQDYIDYFYARETFPNADDFDLCVYLRFYPEVLYESAAIRKDRELHRQLESWRKFRDDIATRKFFDTYPEYDFNIYIYSVLNQKMCLNVRDIDGALKIGTEYEITIPINQESLSATLKKYGLVRGKYITLHTGKPRHASVKHGTRLWWSERYEKLIEHIKNVYPEIKIVQVGTIGNAVLNQADVCLVGQQTFSEFAEILAGAKLHIGIDSGAVHLRKAMKAGPSISLFGPTPSEFYGYENNCNIQRKVCPHWCAGLTDTWRNQCLAGTTPLCMSAITVDEVYKEVKRILEQ